MRNVIVSVYPSFDDDYNFIRNDDGEIIMGVSVYDPNDNYSFFDQTLSMCDFMGFLVLLNNIVGDDVEIVVFGTHHGSKELLDMWEIFRSSNLKIDIEHG